MKKFPLLAAAFCLSVLMTITCSAAEPSFTTVSTVIQPLEDGYYLETTVENTSPATSVFSSNSSLKTVTGKKTTAVKSASGDVLCSLTINASFTYNQTTSKCTACYASSTAPGKHWNIINKKSSKSGKTATATGTARNTANGVYHDALLKVTLTCSASGKLS